jgi:hypothetical protein
MATTVVGLFEDLQHAQAAVEGLQQNGFVRDDISIMLSEAARDAETDENLDRAADITTDPDDGMGSTTGASTGAAFGGAAGLLLGLAAFALPGVGPVLATGPIVAGLSGALLGAATGGVIGALADLGVSEEEAGHYAEGVRRGGVLVTVKTDEATADVARKVMLEHSVIDMNDRVGRWRREGWTGFNAESAPYATDRAAAEVAARPEDRAA